MPRDFEPREFEPLDIEPVDLEPVDLEPVDLEPGGDMARFERRRDRRRAWVWIAPIGAVVVAWAAVALTNHGKHARPTATPAPTNQPTTQPTTAPASAPPVARITSLGPSLRAALRNVGSGHFAAIVDDRLYVIDQSPAHASRVPLPEGHASIDDRNGPSLLVSTFAQTLVSTAPIEARTLSPRDFAIPAVAPGRWWLLRDDGTVRDDNDGALRRVPDGLRPVAAVTDGFVALDANSAWVLWSQSTIRPIGQLGDQLLATGRRTIVFKHDCGYGGCSLDVIDLARGTTKRGRLAEVPQFAAFSPDGTRLALVSTQGDVLVVDPNTGAVIARTRSRISSSPSLPFTWTLDSRALLVVQDHDIQVLRASDGVTARFVRATDGVEQIVALP